MDAQQFLAQFGVPAGADMGAISQAVIEANGTDYWIAFQDAVHGRRDDLYTLLYQDFPTAMTLAVGAREPLISQQLDWMGTRLEIMADHRGVPVPSVLDVGAGSGVAGGYLASLGARALAIDPESKAANIVNTVAQSVPEGSLSAAIASLSDVPAIARSNRLEVVVMQEVLTCIDLELGSQHESLNDVWEEPYELNQELGDAIRSAGDGMSELWILDHPMTLGVWVSIASRAAASGLTPADFVRFDWTPTGGTQQTQLGLALAPGGGGPTGDQFVEYLLALVDEHR